MNKYIENLYNTTEYSDNTGGWCPDEDKEKAKTIKKILRVAGIKSEISSIIDIGCGTGGIIKNVKNSFNKDIYCEGIDFSVLAIKKAQESDSNQIIFSTKKLTELDMKFDLVILSHVLEHVMDWDSFLEELSKVANNYIYINVPLEVNLINTLRGSALTGTYKNYGHVHFFDEDFVLNYLIDSDFEIIAKEYGEEFKVANSTIRGRFARLPRLILGIFSKRLAARIFGGYSLAILIRANDIR